MTEEDVNKPVGNSEEEENIIDPKDDTLPNQVAYQRGRLQFQTERLLQLADQWESVAKRETLPGDVVDEVDCVVGQTRLLTRDKFQQFNRLVDQYEQKTGDRIITWDDVDGFWDMLYLQVMKLYEGYAALDCLKNKNWTKPEPERKKRRRIAKPKEKKIEQKKVVPVVVQPENNLSSQPIGDKALTTTTSVKPVITSVGQMLRGRTRSYYPSPYIAMRLSGVGRPSNVVQTPTAALTPKREPEDVASGPSVTPKSACKNWIKLTESSKKRRSLLSSTSIKIKIEKAEELPASVENVEATENVQDANENIPEANEMSSGGLKLEPKEVPAFTPRRSMRLMAKATTPATCHACEHSCKKSACKARSPRANLKPPQPRCQ